MTLVLQASWKDFSVFFFPAGFWVGILNLIVFISVTSILTLHKSLYFSFFFLSFMIQIYVFHSITFSANDFKTKFGGFIARHSRV